jgi:hypothetical protein
MEHQDPFAIVYYYQLLQHHEQQQLEQVIHLLMHPLKKEQYLLQ